MSAIQNERYALTKTRHGLALEWVQEPLPRPEAGEVRVRIHAAGVAYSDLLRLRGLYPAGVPLPYTPGWDMAGEVDELGAGVTGLQRGQPVVALTGTGNFARYRTVQASELIPQPPGLDPAEAVSLCLNYVTAYQLLHRLARAKAGESVLIHGAAGGVGTAVLQLGRIAGLKCFGVASKGRLETVTNLGAVAIDRQADDFVQRVRSLPGGGVDIALDPVGGKTAARSFRALRRGGRYVSFGMSSMVDSPKAAAPFQFIGHFLRIALWNLGPTGRRANWYSIGGIRARRPGWIREDLALLLEWLRDGRVAPLVSARLPLREAPRALEMLNAGKVQGKLVLMCQE